MIARYLLQNFIPYAQYRTPSKYHDIALVELQENISFNKYVVPICPDFQTEDLPVTENLTVADGVVSNHLMYAPVRTLPLEVCKAAYADPNLSMILQNKLSSGVIDKQYCAVGNFTENPFDNIDACQGDSGGPLQGLRNNTVFLIGVISAGIGCGSALPGLYARVGSYFEWIYTTITESESRQTCPPNRS
uniref:Peptidase S1 domain-containing protein n=1 Tax=Anopheles minimus TaxID=112268 RepID=A0A182WAT9_9DIPT